MTPRRVCGYLCQTQYVYGPVRYVQSNLTSNEMNYRVLII